EAKTAYGAQQICIDGELNLKLVPKILMPAKENPDLKPYVSWKADIAQNSISIDKK
ncbi:MAG: hypothetical protein MHPSP_003702, partial [Paramarteilia canceri]